MTDINDVYRQRNNLAIAFCKAALAAGWPAGRGVDDTKEPDDEWRHVVYVDLPSGDQVSWHMAPCAVHLLEGLPEYKGKWEGTFTARHKNWPKLIDVHKRKLAFDDIEVLLGNKEVLNWVSNPTLVDSIGLSYLRRLVQFGKDNRWAGGAFDEAMAFVNKIDER